MNKLNKHQEKMLLQFQENEITEYHIYNKIAKRIKNKNNREVLEKIANEELEHYHFWKKHTGKEVRPDRWKIFRFYWIIRLLGLTFGIKLMEKGEEGAQEAYRKASRFIPGAEDIVEDENNHEEELIGMIKEKQLSYIGSIVLGLNDALVELTGALAGLTFALQNNRLVALAGLITGIAASFSMAASEYLSKKADEKSATALISSAYTGGAYIITVIILILPYLLFSNYLISLGLTLFFAVLIIFLFNYYISVAKDLNFKKRFLEMAGISLGVAAFSFGIGFIVRQIFGVEI